MIDTLLASVCKKYSSIENYLKNLFEGLSYKKKFKLPIHSKSLSDTQNTGEKLNENRDKNLQVKLIKNNSGSNFNQDIHLKWPHIYYYS